MNSKTTLIFILYVISFAFSEQKLKFSADSVESYKDNGINAKLFKNNVQIIDQDKILYTDIAKYYQDSNKVILNGNVRMYDNSDSLFCDQLIHLYKYGQLLEVFLFF